MEEKFSAIATQAQKYIENIPVIVLGSGASVSYGLPTMGVLAKHLKDNVNGESDSNWSDFIKLLDDVMEFNWLNKLVEALIGVNSENSKAGIKIIDFSEVPSDILPLIVSLIARLSFSVQQWTEPDARHPIALLCDEAHLYIANKSNSSASDDISLSIFERIAKEGRKYGLSLVVISQRPSEVNRTVLSQCSNFIAMRLTNTDDQMVIKKLLPDNLGGFGDILPILDTGEALVVGDASLLPSRIRIDKPSKTPNSATVDFWDEWQNEVSENRIKNAVDNWRKQNIG